ncbi:unnamed protein product, partial [Rotaria sp. Silwood1]
EKILSDEMARLIQQCPEGYSKPIHALQAVDDNVDGEWERRLQQAKNNHDGEQIALIPYNLGNFHWIGVLIKFKADGKIERAEFIDPVKESSFTPNKLQEQFFEVFPHSELHSRTCAQYGDRKDSAMLIVKYLLKAVEESLFTEVEPPNMNNLYIQPTDDQQQINYSDEHQPSNQRQED